MIKPFGKYSRSCYNFLHRKIKKGHCGTLDKYAKGLMIIITGNSTKLSLKLSKLDKKYFFTMIFNIDTFTNDLYGYIKHSSLSSISTQIIQEICVYINSFKNYTFMQKCPLVSSKKIMGKSCYEYFYNVKKKNLEISNDQLVKHNLITIYSASVCYANNYSIDVFIHVSSGFYIRSFVRDIAKKFGIYACVYNIQRLQIGQFNILDSL